MTSPNLLPRQPAFQRTGCTGVTATLTRVRIAAADHRALASWAATCAAHVLDLFESASPGDDRPRAAIDAARSWAEGALPVGRARAAGFAAHAAARETSDPTARAVARAAGHAASTAHVAEHARHAAHYAATAAARAAPAAQARDVAAAEREWQRQQLPAPLASMADELLADRPTPVRPTTHRLFVSLWPAAEPVAHLAAALDGQRPGDRDLRWQAPDRWHITLAFLGDVDPGRTRRALGTIPLPEAEPLRLAGAGTFGPVVWIGVEHGGWLSALADQVRGALRVDDGLFRPHLTICRARGRQAVALARAASQQYASYAGPAWTPHELTLVRSFTGPSPRYDVIAAWPLVLADLA